MNVQAFLNNISFPKSLDELELFADKFNVEEILTVNETEWTAPKWAVKGDVVFFFHAKTAIQWITKLETQLKNEKVWISKEKVQIFENALKRARSLYKNYGGKIFAIGRVSGRPFYDRQEGDEIYHWNSRLYVAINEIWVLQEPVDISEFSNFIFVSRQSAITPVVGNDFEQLKTLIERKNEIPQYLKDSKAVPLPLQKINEKNWLEITQTYRRLFMLEIQFRRFYVDYFLRVLGNQKKFLSECECYQGGKRTGFADNAVKIDGKWCFVEVKLNIKTEAHLCKQVKKYCLAEKVTLKGERVLDRDEIWQNNVLVIDTEDIYVYHLSTDQLTVVKSLDEISEEKDIKALRENIIPLLQ